MKSIKEKFLLFRIRTRQDADAFGELYDHYVKPIYRFIYFKVSSAEHAEDLTSETFLKAWQYLKEKREVTSLQAFLYSVARNAVIDHYRTSSHEHHNTTLDDAQVNALADSSGEKLLKDIDTSLNVASVIEKIHGLKDEYREVIIMKYLDDMDTSEIGEALGKTSTNVRVLLHRALKSLEQQLSPHEKRHQKSSSVGS